MHVPAGGHIRIQTNIALTLGLWVKTKFSVKKIMCKHTAQLIIIFVVPVIIISFSISSIRIVHGVDCPVPDTATWKHSPILFRSANNTVVDDYDDINESLPLGVPFHFESPVFKGTMLVRLRNAPTDDPQSHHAYFHGRKRLMQTVVQGQFKKPIKMSDVYVGSVFPKPLSTPPPSSMQAMMNAIFRRVAPSVVMDLISSQPKVLALYAGTAQSVSVNVPGEQPDITAVLLPENMAAVWNKKGSGKSTWASDCSLKRKKKLSQPKTASQYMYDTDHVYTFHSYNDVMDYGTYEMKIPMYGKYNFASALGGQPMTLSAVLKDGTFMYSFQVWHKDVCQPSDKYSQTQPSNYLASK
jgi:hypothetical protein